MSSQLSCQFCGFKVGNINLLAEHLKTTHVIKPPAKVTTKWLCVHCCSNFTRKYNLNRHESICRKNLSNKHKLMGKRIKEETEKAAIRCCKFCGKRFTRTFNLKHHEKRCGEIIYGENIDQRSSQERNTCSFCTKTFASRTRCLSHMRQCCMGGVSDMKLTYNYRCLSCNTQVKTRRLKYEHYKNCIGSGLDRTNSNIKFNIVKGDQFKNTSFQYFIVPKDLNINHLTNLSLWKMILQTRSIIEQYQNNRKRYPALKINVVLKSEFSPSIDFEANNNKLTMLKNSDVYLQSKMTYECYPATDVLSDILEPMYKDLIQAIDDFEHRGSGFRLKTFSQLELVINISNPMRCAACNSNEHLLPLHLARKHALVQVAYSDKQDNDNHCFEWSVYAAIYTMFHPAACESVSTSTLKSFVSQHRLQIDFSMFKWPVNVWYERSHPEMKMFKTFEDRNDISLNIYTVNGCYRRKRKRKKKNSCSQESRNDGSSIDKEVLSSSQNMNLSKSNTKNKIQTKSNKRCSFINDECDVEYESDCDVSSGNESSENDEYEIDPEIEKVLSNDTTFYRLVDMQQSKVNTLLGEECVSSVNIEPQENDSVTNELLSEINTIDDSASDSHESKRFSNQIQPIRVTKVHRKFHIDLLVIENQFRKNDLQHHFVAIKDFDRFVSGNNYTKGKHYHCRRCLQSIRVMPSSENDPTTCERFQEHIRLCNGFKLQRLQLPSEEDGMVAFNSIRKQQEVPFVMYGDFETIQVQNPNIVKIDKRSGVVNIDKEGNEMFLHYDDSSSEESNDGISTC